MSHRLRTALVLSALAVVAVIGLPEETPAQCSLCASSAEASGDAAQVRDTFLGAVGLLLVPTVGLLGGAGFLLWRFRDPGRGQY